jgi:Ca2+-binding RTX toxin-like protein
MAQVSYEVGNALFLPPDQTFDITSIVAKRFGAYVGYYSFGSDGTMFVIRSTMKLGADGLPVATIVEWDHYNGADILQTGITDLPLQHFLDIMGSRNPSSTKAFAWLMGTDDTMTGSVADDLMKGLGGNDTLSGGLGNDKLLGGAGNDLLQGDGGRDALQGQAGDDTLVGGFGKDVLSGGTGADVFLFHTALEGGDKITDFASGIDHIGLDKVGFGLASLTDGVNFISATGATATNGVPTVQYDSATGILSFDADGTGAGAAVTLATLTLHPNVSIADFWLI